MLFKKKKSKIKLLFSNQLIISLLGLIIIVMISFPLAKNISKQYEINSEINQLQTEISQLNDKNENLKSLISFLESDQFIDEEARKNLNFKKEGEEVVVIKGDLLKAMDENSETNSIYMINQAKPDDNGRVTNPKKWLKYFFASRKQ